MSAESEVVTIRNVDTKTAVSLDNAQDDKPQIGVMGGGLAGLAFAFELCQMLGSKADITILDAKNRIGGRMHTDPVYGDLGWGLFGSTHEEIWDFALRVAQATNTDEGSFFNKIEPSPSTEPAVEVASGKRYFDKDMNEFDAAVVEKELALINARVREEFANYDLSKFDKHNLTDTEKAADSSTFADWYNKQKIEGVTVAGDTIYRAITEGDNGVSMAKMNHLATILMNYAMGRTYEGGTEGFRINGGASKLIDLLSNYLAENGVKIVLNTPVEVVQKGEAVVRLNNQETQTFDKLAIAVSSRQYSPCYSAEAARLQVGECVFYGLDLGVEGLEKLKQSAGSVETCGPCFQTWEGGVPGTLMVYSGGPAYADAADGPPYAALEKVFPGIKGMVKSYGTGNWPKEPYIGGSFAFHKPGGIAAAAQMEREANTSNVAIFGDGTSVEFPGYANGAVKEAQAAAARIAREVEDLIEIRTQKKLHHALNKNLFSVRQVSEQDVIKLLKNCGKELELALASLPPDQWVDRDRSDTGANIKRKYDEASRVRLITGYALTELKFLQRGILMNGIVREVMLTPTTDHVDKLLPVYGRHLNSVVSKAYNQNTSDSKADQQYNRAVLECFIAKEVLYHVIAEIENAKTLIIPDTNPLHKKVRRYGLGPNLRDGPTDQASS
jgi:monoamine oxidase